VALAVVVFPEQFRRPARVAALLGAFAFATALSGCSDASNCSTGPGASSKSGVVGCGGPYDDIYRNMYTPGRGTDFGA
jgi:hypothetical protein